MTGAAWSLPRVLAHRCGGTLAPENTLAGLAVAASLGCGGVEFDVMLSGDGSPVLIHDETLERTTSGRGRVAATSDRELFSLDAGSRFDARFRGEHVPALQAALRRCLALGLAVNLEIKPSAGADEATADAVVAALRELWTPGSPPLLLSSFSRRALARAAERGPEFARGLLVDALPPDWAACCAALRAVSLNVKARHLDVATVQTVHATGLHLVCYTVNDPVRARTLLAWGVDCVVTDRPDIVRAPPAPEPAA